MAMNEERRELPKRETPFTKWLNAQLERALESKTQGRIASAVGISTGHLAMLRYGDRVPSAHLLAALVKVLGGSGADAERARDETARLQKAERASRMDEIKAEREWGRAWRRVIDNTDPELGDATRRAVALRELVDRCALEGARPLEFSHAGNALS